MHRFEGKKSSTAHKSQIIAITEKQLKRQAQNFGHLSLFFHIYIFSSNMSTLFFTLYKCIRPIWTFCYDLLMNGTTTVTPMKQNSRNPLWGFGGLLHKQLAYIFSDNVTPGKGKTTAGLQSDFTKIRIFQMSNPNRKCMVIHTIIARLQDFCIYMFKSRGILKNGERWHKLATKPKRKWRSSHQLKDSSVKSPSN